MASEDETVSRVFGELGDLETEFERVELAAIRKKEHALSVLYRKRQILLDQIPSFWPTVLGNAPEEVQTCFTESDLTILACIKSLCIERHLIEDENKGDPRGLRFTFEFERNNFFEDAKLVKEFVHRENAGLVSTPVPIKWKNKKQDPTGGALDMAVQLYNAEETLKAETKEIEIDQYEREGLWAYEQLSTRLNELATKDGEEQPSFFCWFGYRGPVPSVKESHKKETREAKQKRGDVDEGHSDEEDEEDEEDGEDDLLDVEIFPGGDEVAIALVDDLWPSVMDYFIAAQSEEDDQFDGENGFEVNDDLASEEDVPDLVPAVDARPKKRPRMG